MPNVVLRQILAEKIQEARQNPAVVAQIFRSLSRQEQDQIQRFVVESKFDIRAAYKNAPISLPGITIATRSTKEAMAFLGNELGEEYGGFHEYNGLNDGVGSTQDASAPPRHVLSPPDGGAWAVSSATASTVVVDSAEFGIGAWNHSAAEVVVIAGTGVGQVRGIADTGIHGIDVTPDWGIIPDATSRIQILAGVEEGFVGAPAPLFDLSQPTATHRLGVYESHVTSITVADTDESMALYLARLVRAWLLIGQIRLEREGLHNMRASESDLTVNTAMLPDNAFARSITLEYEAEFSVTEAMDDAITGELDLSVVPVGATVSVSGQTATIGLTAGGVQ